MDVHETVRTLMFREQLASLEVPLEGKLVPRPLFLNGLSDADNSCDFGGSPMSEWKC